MVKMRQILKDNTIDEKIILAMVLSIFISVYLCVAVMAAVLIYLIKKRRVMEIMNGVNKSVYIVAFGALAVVVSMIYGSTYSVLISMAMCGMFFLAMFIQTSMTQRFFHKLLDVCCIGSIFCFAVAVVQQLFALYDAAYRPSSTFQNPNYYATIIEFVVVLCVYALIKKQSGKRKLFYAVVIAMNLIGLYLCDCRTAWVAIFLAVAFMLLINKKYKALGIQLACGVVFIGLIYFMPSFMPRMDSLSSDLNIRKSIWSASIQGFTESPLFGLGTDAYSSIYKEFGGFATYHSHNLYLDVLLNYGIIGAALLAAYFLANFKPVFRIYTQGRDREMFSLLVGATLVVLIHGLTDTTIFFMQTGLLFAVMWSCTGIYVVEPQYGLSYLPQSRWARSQVTSIVKKY